MTGGNGGQLEAAVKTAIYKFIAQVVMPTLVATLLAGAAYYINNLDKTLGALASSVKDLGTVVAELKTSDERTRMEMGTMQREFSTRTEQLRRIEEEVRGLRPRREQ